MKKNWWKILAALLLLYTILAGFLIPLKSGIEYVNKDNVNSGADFEVRAYCYNTHFSEVDEIRAWLKIDSSHIIKAKEVKAVGNLMADISFSLPQFLPNNKSHVATLIIDNKKDGYAILPSAIQINQIAFDTILPEENFEYVSSLDNELITINSLSFPYRNILYETIRNLFFHVPLWFGMLIIFLVSMIYSILYLRNKNEIYDMKANAFTQVGILFGILGLVTGAVWARWTWGAWWSFDVKQNMSAIAMLIYIAYSVLRASFDDVEQRSRVSAVYNIFAFSTLIPLLFVIPRLYDSLHPGNGGNPGFGGEDLDDTMRMVFYPSIIAWTLIGVWVAQLTYRYLILKNKLIYNRNNKNRHKN